MNDSKDTVINVAQASDLLTLHDICRKAYSENFASHWNPGGLEWYLDKVYSMDGVKRDLSDPEIRYFMAFVDDSPVGFMKLKLNADLEGFPGSALEVEKVYFRSAHQQKGLGKRMLEQAFLTAEGLQKKIVWLGVIDTNFTALAFYKKLGFREFDKVRLDLPYFRDELRGMWRMVKDV